MRKTNMPDKATSNPCIMSVRNPMTNINIRTESRVKNESEAVFNELGLSMSAAVNLFLRQVIRTGSIPFEIKSAKNEQRKNDSDEA